MENQPLKTLKTSKLARESKQNILTFRRAGLVVGILVLVFALTFFVQTVITNTGILISPETEAEERPFEIISEPLELATVGEEYLYFLRIGQYDSPKVRAVVEVKPE